MTLVANKGRKKGQHVTGSLELYKTSSSDHSPRTGEKAYGDVKKNPLYGATDVDFSIVWAPVTNNPEDIEPVPTSLDPVFPGVLVIREESHDILAISTVANRRTKEMWTDGSGIALKPLQKIGSEIRGQWESFGIVAGGGGYFCITPVEQTRNGLN